MTRDLEQLYRRRGRRLEPGAAVLGLSLSMPRGSRVPFGGEASAPLNLRITPSRLS